MPPLCLLTDTNGTLVEVRVVRGRHFRRHGEKVPWNWKRQTGLLPSFFFAFAPRAFLRCGSAEARPRKIRALHRSLHLGMLRSVRGSVRALPRFGVRSVMNEARESFVISEEPISIQTADAPTTQAAAQRQREAAQAKEPHVAEHASERLVRKMRRTMRTWYC